MTKRQLELIRRAGRDPVEFDKRPLTEIMDDEIPYERWRREAAKKKAGPTTD